MADLTPFALSKMFTQLTGRTVGFSIAPDAPSDAQMLYAVYAVKPGEGVLVVKADIPLIASLGGALLGLPKDTVLERAKQKPPDESLRDAMHEVLNVASTPLSWEHRAVFQKFFTDPLFLSEEARNVMEHPLRTDRFEATVDGYAGGKFAVYSAG